MSKLDVYKLGTVPYRDALELQHALLELRKEGKAGDSLILLEHPHTLTTGRRGNMDNLLVYRDALEKKGIHFEIISRGGDITYHGPGQIVGYPIIDLTRRGRNIHRYLKDLEEALIHTLACYGIEARRVEGVTGVWVKWHKIASIGVGVKRWVTYHGFALNVNTDLSYFDMIVPCGIKDVRMTSIQRWLAKREQIDMAEAEQNVVDAFCRVFDMTGFNEITFRDFSYGDSESLKEELMRAASS